MTTQKPYGTVLIKASLILDHLSSSNGPQSLQSIAKETGLTSSTALKILDTLALIGYVQKDPELKRFSLGPSIIKYALKALSQLDIKQIAQPHLEAFQARTNETVHLGILDHIHVVYVAKIESQNPVCLYSKVGKNIPLYCSAMGKAILADQSDEEIRRYLNSIEMVKMTDKTITTHEGFFDEIEKVRAQGYAFDNSEHENEVFCVGTSITTSGGKNVGAISVSVPTYRLTDEVLQILIKEVETCRNNILNDLE